MYAIDGSLRRSIGDVAAVIAQVTIMRSMLDLAKNGVSHHTGIVGDYHAKHVGFGFNQGDKHINGMFREQIDRQNKPACYLADQLNRWGTAGRSATGRE